MWTIAALGFTCTTLLWGLGWSWLGLVVALLAIPVRRWRKGYACRRTPFDVPVTVFFLASLVGLAVSPDRGLSLTALQSVVACILLYYALASVPRAAHIKWGFALSAAGVFVGGLLALRDGFTAPSITAGFGTWVQQELQHLPEVPRVASMSHPILSAAHGLTIAVEMVLFPMLGLVLFAREMSVKAIAALGALPLLTLLLLFGSQGAWLSVVAGVVLLLVWRSRWSVLPVGAALGLGLIGYWQGWLSPSAVFSHFCPSHSLNARVDLWSKAVVVIRDHPVAGCGLGCLGKYSTTAFLSPHDAYLQFYADTGVLGGLALLGALVAAGRIAFDLVRAPKVHPWYGFAVGLVGAAMAVAVHGIFEGAPAGIIAETPSGYSYILSPVVSILAGLFAVTTRLIQESAAEAPPRIP